MKKLLGVVFLLNILNLSASQGGLSQALYTQNPQGAVTIRLMDPAAKAEAFSKGQASGLTSGAVVTGATWFGLYLAGPIGGVVGLVTGIGAAWAYVRSNRKEAIDGEFGRQYNGIADEAAQPYALGGAAIGALSIVATIAAQNGGQGAGRGPRG